MSRKKQTQEQEVIEAEVVETESEVIDEEPVEIKEGLLSKVKTGVKKAAPFVLGALATLVAGIVIGRASADEGDDGAYMAALESEYNWGPEDTEETDNDSENSDSEEGES